MHDAESFSFPSCEHRLGWCHVTTSLINHPQDPYLGAALVFEAVKGIQSNGIIATAKHYILNNQEYQRVRVRCRGQVSYFLSSCESCNPHLHPLTCDFRATCRATWTSARSWRSTCRLLKQRSRPELGRSCAVTIRLTVVSE